MSLSDWAKANPGCFIHSLSSDQVILPTQAKKVFKMSSHPFRYVPGCSVEYRGPTNTQGGRWVAVIKRGRDRVDQYRITTPFAAGPDAAARAAVARLNNELLQDRPDCDKWVVLGAALSMDGGDRYAYPVGPANLCSVLPLTASEV